MGVLVLLPVSPHGTGLLVCVSQEGTVHVGCEHKNVCTHAESQPTDEEVHLVGSGHETQCGNGGPCVDLFVQFSPGAEPCLVAIEGDRPTRPDVLPERLHPVSADDHLTRHVSEARVAPSRSEAIGSASSVQQSVVLLI